MSVWCCTVGWLVNIIFKECLAFIFQVSRSIKKGKIGPWALVDEGSVFLCKAGNHQGTHCHIQLDWNPGGHFIIVQCCVHCGGTRWCIWSRHCAVSPKVAGSIPDGVLGFFHWHNRSGRTMAPGVDSYSNRNEYQKCSLGVKAAGE
jgi:hypothetical protein